jgi:glycosyltransferase involved in cell wall biosynthesis
MVVYAPYPIGETRVQREAEALVDAGFEVDVICMRDEGEPARSVHQGVQIHRLPVWFAKASLARQFLSYLRFLVLATVRLTALHRRRRYTSVQVHNLPDFLVFCAVVPKFRGVPVILDLHDLMPEFVSGRFGADRHRLLQRMIRWQERWACRFADHVITVSDHWREVLEARGVPAGKCSVVMNLADERIFTARPRHTRTDHQYRLLYHGTVTYRYGLDLAVRAVGLLADGDDKISLTVLGHGDQMPELFELVRELGLEDRVELRDELLPAEELPSIIAGADLGVVPYRDDVFTDGLLPTKLMEYAAVGLPSVAARTTAIEHYFRDTMVEFFTPGDAEDLARVVRELCASPDELERLANAAGVFRAKHNWHDAGRAYVELVVSLSAGGG